MISIDTGYLVALADDRDELHERALRWSRTLREPALLTEYVVLETLNLLSSPEDRPRAHALLDAIRAATGYEVVSVDEPLLERGITLHRDRPDKAWSLTDCVSFLVMGDRLISRALAYDRHFEQAGFEPLLRRDPA